VEGRKKESENLICDEEQKDGKGDGRRAPSKISRHKCTEKIGSRRKPERQDGKPIRSSVYYGVIRPDDTKKRKPLRRGGGREKQCGRHAREIKGKPLAEGQEKVTRSRQQHPPKKLKSERD